MLYIDLVKSVPVNGHTDQQIEDKAAEAVCIEDRLFTFQQTANICHLKEGGSGQFVTNYPNVHIERMR